LKLFRSSSAREDFFAEALPHRDALFRTALSKTRSPELAEDMVQEAYKEAWRSFGRYQPGSNCKAWLFTILFRVIKRHGRPRFDALQIGLDQVPQDQLSIEPRIEEQLDTESLLAMLHSLPEHYRLVLVLSDIESLSYREIADSLGIPIGTVMSRLNRARSLFRQKLDGEQQRARRG